MGGFRKGLPGGFAHRRICWWQPSTSGCATGSATSLHRAMRSWRRPSSLRLAGFLPTRVGATLSAILGRDNDNSVFHPVPVPEQLRMRLLACCAEPDLRVYLTD